MKNYGKMGMKHEKILNDITTVHLIRMKVSKNAGKKKYFVCLFGMVSWFSRKLSFYKA